MRIRHQSARSQVCPPPSTTAVVHHVSNFPKILCFPQKVPQRFGFFHISVFYSGLIDLVRVKMSNTNALSSSSPHSSVCPSVFSDVSQCWLANLLLASLERSSGPSGSTWPPRCVPGPFSLPKQRGINRSPGQRLLSPPTSPHSSQRTRVSQAIAEPITPQSTVWENCSGPAAARAQPAHGLDPLSRELTLGHGCLGSVGHGKKLMATSRMAKKATIKVSNLMKSRKSLNR